MIASIRLRFLMKLGLVGILLGCGLSSTIAADGLQAELQDGQFVVRDLPPATLRALKEMEWTDEQWRAAIAVRVVLPNVDQSAKLPELLGDYEVDGTAIHFRPRYALRPGKTYEVLIRPKQLPHTSGLSDSSQRFTIPEADRPDQPPTEVTAVYPSGDVLPENLLKFYIHFSAPMQRAQSYPHLRLMTEDGAIVEYPFLELPEELWDPDRTRFTLFFDPGRIKRGLKPRELFGPALEEGKTYVFEIDPGWKDAEGRPLRRVYRKTFRVVAPDDDQPDPARWDLQGPADKDQPLVVNFDEPLDRGMLERVLQVQNAEGQRIAGSILVDQGEQRWTFTPDAPWQRGTYRLRVATNLEDRAGNSIARPFEVDLFDTVERQVVTPTIEREFTVNVRE